MVEMLVELVAPTDRVDDVLQALQVVMRPARLDRRCCSASIWQATDDWRRFRYLEAWTDASAFESEARGQRIGRLLELLEIAAQAPVLEVRFVDGIRGLEYLAEVRGAAII